MNAKDAKILKGREARRLARKGFLENNKIPGIKKITLENGLTVFFEELRERKKVIFLLGVGVGSRDEQQETRGVNYLAMKHGISHFTEHLHFISNRFRATDKITEDVEDGGAYISAGTGFGYTDFYIEGYPRHLAKNIRIIYEIINNFEYKKDELEREGQEVLTELKDSFDSPKDAYLYNLFYPVLFRGTSFEKPILGTQKTIKNISQEDIIAFKKKYYVPANMAIFVCGKFDGEKTLKAIDKTFGRMKSSEFEAAEPKINFENRHKEFLKRRKSLKLVYMALGYKTPGFNHPDSLKLMLLDSILSGGMSCRLYRRLRRERGIGYSEVVSDYHDFDGLIGNFHIRIGGFDHCRFKEAKKIILKELDDLKTNLISKREFLRAKNLFLANTDDILEKLETRAELLADAYFGKYIYDPRNYKKYIGKISREALRRTARKYFSDKYTLTALVPENFKK